MLFRHVIGQDDIKKRLKAMADSNRLPHAQLFLGPGGSGKLALAFAFACYILCEDRQDGDACGQCNACRKTSQLIHPDVHFSYPTVGSKVISTHFLKEWREHFLQHPYSDLNAWLQFIGAENKQGNITKDECVDIVKKLSLKTFEAPYKILIMWMPEYLGKEGNRLLKLIEEPPENTLFLLVAENDERILNTILSRCQTVKVQRLADEAVQKGLMEKLGLAEERALEVAQLASGNFNEAIRLAGNKENDNARLFLEWMRLCYKGQGPEIVPWVEKMAKIGRENQKQWLQYGLFFMREYLSVKWNPNQPCRLQDSEKTTAQNMTKVMELDQVQLIAELLSQTMGYVERNANPKVLFLDMSIQMHQILRRKTPALV